MRYKTCVYTSAGAGLAVPLISAEILHLLTASGVDPLSSAAGIYRLVAALAWPTFIPFSMLLGGDTHSKAIDVVLFVDALVNAIIYVLLGSLFWLAASRKGFQLLFIIPGSLIAAYWCLAFALLAV